MCVRLKCKEMILFFACRHKTPVMQINTYAPRTRQPKTIVLKNALPKIHILK